MEDALVTQLPEAEAAIPGPDPLPNLVLEA